MLNLATESKYHYVWAGTYRLAEHWLFFLQNMFQEMGSF